VNQFVQYNYLIIFLKGKIMKTKKLFSLLAILVFLLAALPVISAGAAGTVTVMPSDVGVTWNTNDTRSGGSSAFVTGPGSPPLGLGSLQFTTTDTMGGSGQAKAQLFNYQFGSFGVPGDGVALADIDEMSYWTYRASTSTNPAAQTISLNIEVDDIGDGTGYTTLVFEPVYQSGGVGAMALDTWQKWDAFDNGNAVWWSTKNIPGVCAFDCFVSWSTIIANNPNAEIKYAFGFNVGSGWVGDFEGYTDALVFGVAGDSTTFDFEPEPTDNEGPITTDVEANPNPVAVDSPVTVTANVDDTTTGGSNIASAEYSLDGGTTWSPMDAVDGTFNAVSEDVTKSFTAPSEAGIYDLCVRGTDEPGIVGESECIMLVVYDPDGGFVTGGGWIDSPPGAYKGHEFDTPTLVWNQDFSLDDTGWLDDDDAWYGDITVSGGTATFYGDADSAPFSRFDGYRDVWPGTWTAGIDVYLDPSWPSGQGFDYSVAASGSDGNHQRDYIFHVGVVDGHGLLVNGSNNADFTTNPYKLVNENGGNYYTVSNAGWYTLQHVFYDAGGYLAVDLNLLDSSGTTLWNATRENTADTIPGEVGGNRYAWFTHIDVANGILVDNHQLIVPTSPPGKATFGFVSKYKKGASVPTGNTEFQFKAGDLNFHSTEYQWLVINQNDMNAQFKGYGTINGAGNYGFMLWAGDGTGSNGEDTFRIKIWDVATDAVVYDNGMKQTIGGGSIVVHKAKK